VLAGDPPGPLFYPLNPAPGPPVPPPPSGGAAAAEVAAHLAS
jgi:hypothetical protein